MADFWKIQLTGRLMEKSCLGDRNDPFYRALIIWLFQLEQTLLLHIWYDGQWKSLFEQLLYLCFSISEKIRKIFLTGDF